MAEVAQQPQAELAIQRSYGGQLQEVDRTYQTTVASALTKRNLAIGGTAAVGLLVLTPIAWAIATAAASLAVAGVISGALVAGGIYAKMRLPLWIQKGHDRVSYELLVQANKQKERIQQEMNRALSALKAEARKNPIEQLQNYLLEKQRRLEAFKTAVSQIGGQVKTLADMLRERKLAKPGKDYSKKDESLVAMQAAYNGLRTKAEQGDHAIIDLREVIDDQKFDWKFAQVGQSAVQNLKAMNGQDLLNEVLAGESFDAVRENFNKVFSDIEVEIGNINSGKALSFGEGNDGLTIDISAIHIDQPQMKERVS
jgi:hypothetical protein